MKKRQRKIWAGVVVGVSFGVSLVAIGWVKSHLLVVQYELEMYPLLAPLLSIGLYALLSMTPIPTDPLSLVNGAVFGPVEGTLVSWMGNNVAASLEYILGVEMAELLDLEERKKRLPRWVKKLNLESPSFLIVGRFIPSFGGKIVGLVAGMLRVPLLRYVWTAATANLIGAVFYAMGGYKLMKLF